MACIIHRIIQRRSSCFVVKTRTLQVTVLRPRCLSDCFTFADNTPSSWSLLTASQYSPVELLQSRQLVTTSARHFGTSKESKEPTSKDEISEPEPKLSLFQRFKQMYRDYWYVLIPVHVATSAVWAGGFYYLATSGVDVIGLLESMGAGERIVSLLKNSSTGYFAITYALYKIATPARYFITVAGTTVSINYLKRWGYIKPIPPKEKLKEMYQERRDSFKDNMRERRDSFFKGKDKD